jgi:MFS family permease
VFGPVSRTFRWRLLTVASIAFAVALVSAPASSFVFVYAQNILKLSGVTTAVMVVVAGPFGLLGLLVGRWLADNVGRRLTGGIATVAIALSATFAYSGSSAALLLGYELGVLSGSIFAPAAGALVNELFPTSVRSSVAGWNIAASVAGAVIGLVAFGAIAQAGNRYALGAAATFLPMTLAAGLFLRLPETRGREPEDLWPQPDN